VEEEKREKMKYGKDIARNKVREEVKNTILLNKFRKYPSVIEFVKGKTNKEIILSDFWDELAFGIKGGSLINIPIKKLQVKYSDMDNVIGRSMKEYFKEKPFNSLPPIEVSYENGKFYVEDGHHRLGYAKELGLSHVPTVVELRENPFKKFEFNIDDVIALRDLLKQ
jgi:hypothetical protein